ncbi:MAG TPA: zf-HC2 domain-containing protein [Acidimicrobiia bacterium]|jgi:anti-sigma factor RsiW|nr:zf-HC2 domain-containing protein [Acidimicrobiia bacterium]
MTPPADDFPCDRFVELVTEYLDDALPTDERRRLEEHLDVCGGCGSVLEQFRTVIRTTGVLGEDDVASIEADRREQIMTTFRQWASTRPS